MTQASNLHQLQQELTELSAAFQKELTTLQTTPTVAAFDNFKNTYLGRKSKLAQLSTVLKTLTAQDKPMAGKLLNQTKQHFIQALNQIDGKLTSQQFNHGVTLDITEPGIKQPIGRLHPVTQMTQRIWDIFRSLNFEIVQGPEMETDYNQFEALNIPIGHPARDMQDTFFLPHTMLLRGHTTAVDIREMKHRKPPVRLLATGKTFRRDSDFRHTPMFHQFDGVMIDENITMAHLKSVLHHMMEEILEQKLKARFRISYFPFVEPGAEFDVSCTICNQEGCPTCKHTGWIEIGGCGMLHPNVLKSVGYDPQQVQGWAFGFGIERPFMIKHKIPDLRLFFQNDLRFLEQF